MHFQTRKFLVWKCIGFYGDDTTSRHHLAESVRALLRATRRAARSRGTASATRPRRPAAAERTRLRRRHAGTRHRVEHLRHVDVAAGAHIEPLERILRDVQVPVTDRVAQLPRVLDANRWGHNPPAEIERKPALLILHRREVDVLPGCAAEQILHVLECLWLSARDGDQPDLARIQIISHSSPGIQLTRKYSKHKKHETSKYSCTSSLTVININQLIIDVGL